MYNFIVKPLSVRAKRVGMSTTRALSECKVKHNSVYGRHRDPIFLHIPAVQSVRHRVRQSSLQNED